MPIISEIGRKHPTVRALVWSISTVLSVGALTMIYPFLLMLSGSTKSAVDIKDFDAVPRFLFSDLVLYRKHVEALFNESVDAMRVAYDSDDRSFELVDPPSQPNGALLHSWQQFLQQADLPHYIHTCGYVHAPISRTIPQLLRTFKHQVADEYGGDIDEVNQALGTEFVGWNAFFVLPEDYLLRRNKPGTSPFALAFQAFKQTQVDGFLVRFSVPGFYKAMFLKTQYTREIQEYNRAHETTYDNYDRVRLSRTFPQGGTAREQDDWETFVRSTLNLLWIRAAPTARTPYRAFLQAKYGDIGTLNRNYGSAYVRFADIPLIETPPDHGIALSDWDAFIQGWKDPDTGQLHILPVDMLRIHCVEFMFRDYLLQQHGSLAAVNRLLGTDYQSEAEIVLPQREAHYVAFLQDRARLRLSFVARNYHTVLDYMVFHGRGIVNTVIYCSLAVLFALLVNPLAAYAMSRYCMPSTYKILLFLMLTMAFPPMVTQIPVFLMLRNLRLLNTFAALILPGLANGYSIFLLKGFFDSLPRELYESAELDGANEWTMFWRITMSLSKPILSVIALTAFTRAYSNFMFALLICQDERMWTLMVWLYQLQMRSGQGVIYASLIIAGIPTLVIFIFCQNIIMRGIVVPVEK